MLALPVVRLINVSFAIAMPSIGNLLAWYALWLFARMAALGCCVQGELVNEKRQIRCVDSFV